MATQWGSKLGFIMATAGSAIGLGNIWRFPYLMAKYGGGAFFISYLIAVFGLGVFILMAKLAFGRAAQSDLPQGFEKISKEQGVSTSKFWKFGVGYLGVFNSSLVICVYSIVIGWTLCYAVMGAVNLLAPVPLVMNADTFNLFTSSFGYQLFWICCCVFICVLILSKGVQKGIEKVCLFLMPLLFLFLIFLSVWMACTSEIGKVFSALFNPDWRHFGITESGIDFSVFSNATLAVLGQALYSLSMGFGVIFVYGSYMDKKTDIRQSVFWVAGMDTLVAFLSGFIVMAALMQSNTPLDQGPALTFITLPMIFSKMQGGSLLMSTFFILLFLAALTSIISMYEVPINTMVKGEKMSRKRAAFRLGFCNIVGSTIILLSFTKILPLSIWGKDLFTLSDKITGEYTLSIMMALCCLFMGGKIFPTLVKEIQQNQHFKFTKPFKIYWEFALRWLTPLILLFLIINVL